jgi:alkylation response protein AidB-like acyl-CoA dehydrogenase
MPFADLTAPRAEPTVSYAELLDVLAGLADGTGRPQREALAAVRASTLPGLVVPRVFGGAEADSLVLNRTIAEIAYHDPSTAIFLFQHFAVCARIAEWGTSAQQASLLPRLASGEWLGASAWSEPGGASATRKNLNTVATERADGRWTVNGGKAFTNGAGVADVYLVLAQSSQVSEQDDATRRSSGRSFFLVPASSPGVVPDLQLDQARMPASAPGFVEFENCVVDAGALLGPCDDASRVIAGVPETGATLGAVSVGVAEAAWDMGFRAVRQQSLLGLRAVRHRLVDLRSTIESARALVERAGRREAAAPGELTLHSKIFASQIAEDVVAGVARMLGGSGQVSTCPLNRLVRDARAIALMEPTNDLSRELVSTAWMA